jgi:hypothetical protein
LENGGQIVTIENTAEISIVTISPQDPNDFEGLREEE